MNAKMKNSLFSSSGECLRLFTMMARIRSFEEEASRLHNDGYIPGSLHLSIGQESVAAGVCAALRITDYITSTHRGHGHCLAKGADALAMMAELLGRAGGTCGGKGGSMHVADFSVGVLGANGVVGGGIGIAVGAAQASRIIGKDNVAVCFFGDGAVNRGPFLEGLNWAAVFKIPVLFVCEDNGFAAFSRSAATMAGDGPAARARAIGVPVRSVDGNDVLAVHTAAVELIDNCRAGAGPAFLHAKTYRLGGHTNADKAPYRSKEEVDRQLTRDPLLLLRAILIEAGVSDADLDVIAGDAKAEMTRLRALAIDMPWPDVSTAFDDVQTAGAPQWQR